MKIQRTNNQYKQNFGAICLKPKKGQESLVKNLRQSVSLKNLIRGDAGVNKNGHDVIILNASYQSSFENDLYKVFLSTKKEEGEKSVYSHINIISPKTAAKYIKASQDKYSAPVK